MRNVWGRGPRHKGCRDVGARVVLGTLLKAFEGGLRNQSLIKRRPMRRRAFKILRPDLVFIRARKPHWRTRLILLTRFG